MKIPTRTVRGMKFAPSAACIASAWLAAAGVATLQAQSLVTGVVRDGGSGQPLSNAAVELVPAASPWLAGFAARSDSAGRYTIDGVPAGSYIVGFFHPRLDSIGLTQVSRPLDVLVAQRRIVADLARPDGASRTRALCGPVTDGTGAFVGRVSDAGTGLTLGSGVVTVRWAQLNIGSGGFRSDTIGRQVPVLADGRFLVCDLPMDGPIGVQASAEESAGGARSVSGVIDLQFSYDSPVLHRDLSVAAADDEVAMQLARRDPPAVAPRRGSARLVGRVIIGDGSPIAGARITVRDAGVEVLSESTGTFRLAGLPAGTRSVDMIALGYAPVRTAVDLSPDADALLNIRASGRAQQLGEVTVRSSASFEAACRSPRHIGSLT